MQDRTKPVLIEEELQSSFLDYAMSVVVSRAIPDVRDGFKPVHRRVLYAMNQLGYFYNRPPHKSVSVVGEVMKKYHPHGDQAIYNTMVGMVQDFSKRYPLLDGQGNWGSIDGDNAAAMRYTEIRMKKFGQELLADIDAETVNFVPNFDGSTVEPVVLPSRVPHLLVNGTAGIAVGMATSIPPHNLTEVVNAAITVLENPDLSEQELFSLIPGPDFPTSGIICGRSGIIKAYRTGRGNVVLRGVIEVEETKKGPALVITELPYQVIKADLIIKIADLVKNKVIEGISNIRDESNRKGIRVVIELRRNEMPEVIKNQLFLHTPLQTSISILMLALLDGRPRVFTLRGMLDAFLAHRREVVTRRLQYELRRAQEREHILAGFILALDNIDDVIVLIKASQNGEEAIAALISRYGLSQIQGRAILDMRLQRLTGLEKDKIFAEMEKIREMIVHLKTILGSRELLREEIKKELIAIREEFGDERRTSIEAAADDFSAADLIPDEGVVVTLTRRGYIKRVELETYGIQHRGGRGKQAMAALDEAEDVVLDLFAARNHDELLFFTSLGRIYTKPVYEIPEGSRTAKGRAIVNLIPLQDGERVVKILCARDFGDNAMVMVTKKGVIKRTAASEFASVRSTGIRAVSLNEGDELAFCALSSGSDTIVLVTAQGFAIRFNEAEVRVMGRQAAGVRGIKIRDDDFVVAMEVVQQDAELLISTERGFGKRLRVNDFRVAHRGGMGVRAIPANERNGQVVGMVRVESTSTILLIDAVGKIIRLRPSEIRTMGRQAQGVRLIRLEEEQRLVGIAVVDEGDNEENELVTPDDLVVDEAVVLPVSDDVDLDSIE